MKITLTLSTDESIALRRFANETGEDPEAAAQLAIREYLLGIGMLELPEAENDNDE